MEYNVQIQDVPDTRPLAVVRRRAAAHQLPKVIPDACGLAWNVIRSPKINGAGRQVAVYLDQQINLEVGVELETPFAGFGEVIGSSIPTGKVASVIHLGPYSELHLAHKAVRYWCAVQGCTLAGPRWEIYGHWSDAWNNDPWQIRTEVFYLLSAKAEH